MTQLDLFMNVVATGVLVGSVYAAVALGLAITFGILHIPNIAHPALVIMGGYFVVHANRLGLDPLVAAMIGVVPFYLLGMLLYSFYANTFERRGRADVLQSLTLFFGLSLVIEIMLVLAYGSELKSLTAPYIGSSLKFGPLTIPSRLLVPAILGPVTVGALWLYFK
ncbi:MAG: hypothetical protein WBA88_25140, partial [Pseudaminobacter sp.]